MAFSPDSRWLASASFDRYIKLWDVATGKEMRTLAGHTQWVLSVAFSPDGRSLASGSRDTTVKLWDVATGKPLRTLAGHTDQVHEVTFSPDGRWLASGSLDKTVKLWDAVTWEERRTLAGHSVAFSPDGRSLALLSDEGSRLLDVATWEEQRELAGRFVVAFSPDGRSLAVVSPSASDLQNQKGIERHQKGIELWDLTTWGEQRTLAGRLLGGVSVQSVAFSHDGRALAASSNLNTTVTVWEVATGKQLSTLTGMGIGFSVAFSPDGRWLAAPGYGTKKGSHPLAPLVDWEINLWRSDDARALRRVAPDPLISQESDVTPPPVGPEPLIAQESPAPLTPQESEATPLANADVLKMVAAGLGDAVVIQAIRSRPHSFDLSTDAIVELKTAGVSDDVIAVMLGGSPPEPPEPAVEPIKTFVTIGDGTDLVLQLADPLSSATSQVDDPVRLVVAEDIVIDGEVAVQVGAPARGTVTLARSRKSFGRRGKLDFTIDWVEAVDGSRLRLRYTKELRGDEKYGKAGVIGALFGPFAFFVKGKEVDLSAGTEYTLYIDGEHEIMIGTEPEVTQEHEPTVQENQLSTSRHSRDSSLSIEITDATGATVELKRGNLFVITLKTTNVLDIVTDTKTTIAASRTDIVFTREKVAEPAENHRYLPVGLLLLKNRELQVFYSISASSRLPGAVWPPNVNKKEETISIPNSYTGSGYLYLFVIDASSFGDVLSVTVDGVINAVIVSNIVRQPVRFVEDIDEQGASAACRCLSTRRKRVRIVAERMYGEGVSLRAGRGLGFGVRQL